jgi:DNA-binding transcriptional LysR family regulator
MMLYLIEYFYTFALERLRGVTFDMQISFGEAKEQLTQLELGTLDAVISTAKPTQRALQHRVLGQKQFVLVGPPAVALPAPDLSPAELGAWLNQQAWVSYSVDLPITRRFWHQHLGTRFDARQTIVVPDLRAVLRAVELGYGLSILPEFLCRAAIREGRIQEVWAVRQLIPSDQWILAFREVDADRPAVIQLGDRFAMPLDEPR